MKDILLNLAPKIESDSVEAITEIAMDRVKCIKDECNDLAFLLKKITLLQPTTVDQSTQIEISCRIDEEMQKIVKQDVPEEKIRALKQGVPEQEKINENIHPYALGIGGGCVQVGLAILWEGVSFETRDPWAKG